MKAFTHNSPAAMLHLRTKMQCLFKPTVHQLSYAAGVVIVPLLSVKNTVNIEIDS